MNKNDNYKELAGPIDPARFSRFAQNDILYLPLRRTVHAIKKMRSLRRPPWWTPRNDKPKK